MVMEVKIPIIQLENSKENLTNRMNQAGYRILRPENKVPDLDGTSKEYHFFKHRKGTYRRSGILKKFQNFES